MGAQNRMSLAFEGLLVPATGHVQPFRAQSYSGLGVSVVFTSVESTIAALRKAGDLAARLSARITLLVPQIVPYHLPITSPPVLLDFNEKRFRVMASECSVETTVHIYLCRDRLEALAAILKPHSLVVIGARKRWWPTAEVTMAKHLRRAGHEVITVETD